MTTEELLAKAEAFHKQHGTNVRCPTCGAAEGFFCRNMRNLRVRADAPHPARLKLAGIDR